MHSIMYGDEAPIAAFATTPGNSALTMIRCSGKSSLELVSSIFSSDKLKEAAGNTVVHGWIIDKEKIEKRKVELQTEGLMVRKKENGAIITNKIDEVLISVFRAPKSYTGEDCLDICCHGGNAAGRAVMDILKGTGFRDALPGEFTFRAFMNGKLDLTRCESVMELVSAKTEAGRCHAVSRLSGALQKEINEIKQLLVHVLAGAEIFLDYSEDEISADAEEIAGRLPNQDIAQTALSRLRVLSASWLLERIYQEGITVVIAGRPNAGKSSLFNLLLREDRSIVTEIPGTTRDWIEVWVSIEGIPVRLIDTAGLREAADSVEKIGVERSLKLLEEADIVLYLIDGSEGLTEEDRVTLNSFGDRHLENNPSGTDILMSVPATNNQKKACCVTVWNKSDLSPLLQPFPIKDVLPVCVSAKTGEGIKELQTAIIRTISLKTEDVQLSANIGLGTIRQKKLVDAACAALEEALALTEKEEPLDLITPLIRDAVNSLGEITGEISTADILEEMFSRFCVGK